MAKFKYTAIDQNGKQKAGSIDAASQDEASSKVSAMGLMPTNITEASGAVSAKSKKSAKTKGKPSGFSFGSVVKPEELTTFTRQLATLLQAGLPLLRALEVMTRQEKNLRFKACLEQIADQVKSGNTFSDGLLQHPKVFDRLYVNMIKAGEAGGVLDVVLSRLAGFMEKAQRTKKKVKSAMVYPIVVVGVAVAIVVLLMVVVVPKFQAIFDDMLGGAALPGPTQLVVGMSNFLKENILISMGLIVILFFAMKFLLRTEVGSKAFNWCAINLPKIGDLVTKVNIARITRTFGTLLSSGVPILQAITITKDITGNVFYTNALSRIHDSVRDGESLSAPMAREKVFPDMVTSMVDVGEETGELSEMLNRVADNYDEDVDNAVAGITSIIEPIMIVFLAVVVGFIVIALFLPIVEIIKQLTG
ncbi:MULTISPECIES: type II secretion system F family protein [unclassified Lentimonas]|uniref:type II secretion system F family protein n=1 Tax=unclassified Lentimonas TaxID=2630993 RepID=UPI001328A2EF|nr:MULTISPECIES: type II secretion system F family protein [unclassified Lentimonas]CAA6692904.1 Type IV fimbrial assembly protein PilC [Lentimonas sp. CC10]CAA6695585.1 Type IV fimbrial assembly protein PilC [Lentimonas sp. CC19]CAA7069914.1 Type IV fimbrial assembly protein PilC [Lentimonas sp. CC11]